MGDNISTLSGISTLAMPDITEVKSPAAMMVLVQLILAGRSRDEAVQRMDQLEGNKVLAAEAQKMLNEFKETSDLANQYGGSHLITDAQKQWCRDHGIPLPSTASYYNAAEWQAVVNSTSQYVDSLGSGDQSLMVLIQDSLGKYNAYTQGASSNVASLNNTLLGLSRF